MLRTLLRGLVSIERAFVLMLLARDHAMHPLATYTGHLIISSMQSVEAITPPLHTYCCYLRRAHDPQVSQCRMRLKRKMFRHAAKTAGSLGDRDMNEAMLPRSHLADNGKGSHYVGCMV